MGELAALPFGLRPVYRRYRLLLFLCLRASALLRFYTRELAHLAVFLVARLEQLGGFHLGELVEVFEDYLLQRGGGGVIIPVGAAERFGNGLVHDTEFEQVFRGQLERGSGLRGVGAVLPQDGGATLRCEMTE